MKKSEIKDFQRYANGFKSFKARHKLSDNQISIIMTEYANTVDEQGASFFASKYGFTEHIFYQIKDYTFVFMLVDASTCIRIREKSYRNQKLKNPSGKCSSSVRHYQDLLAIRKEYLKSFSVEEIVKIATEYSDYVALYDIAKAHKISPHTVRRLLAIALANHLVDYDTYCRIKSRSILYCYQLGNFQGYTAENLWNYSRWE